MPARNNALTRRGWTHQQHCVRHATPRAIIIYKKSRKPRNSWMNSPQIHWLCSYTMCMVGRIALQGPISCCSPAETRYKRRGGAAIETAPKQGPLARFALHPRYRSIWWTRVTG